MKANWKRVGFFLLLGIVLLIGAMLALPYSFIPIGLGLVGGGFLIWRNVKVIWLRLAGLAILVSGILTVAMTLLVGYMVLNGEEHRVIIERRTPEPLQNVIVVDNRSATQKLLVPIRGVRCMPDVAGITVSAQTTPSGETEAKHQTITFVGSGFVPNEMLNLFVKQTGNPPRIFGYTSTVHADGTLEYVVSVNRDETSVGFLVQIVHQRGVACIQVQQS